MKKWASFLLPNLSRRQSWPDDHPDADLLAAFSECKLSRAERQRILEHLAGCPNCREILAFASAAPLDGVRSLSASQKPSGAWRPWQLVAATAAGLLIIAGVSQLTRFERRRELPKLVKLQQMAINKPQPVAARLPLPVAPVAKLELPEIAAGGKTHVSSREPRTRPTSPASSVTPLLAQANTPAETRDMPILSAPQRQLALPERNSDFSRRRELQRYTLPSNSMFSADTSAGPARAYVAALRLTEKPVWGLEPSSNPGAIRKSDDGGKTWRAVRIDTVTLFYALSARESDIWVGGSAGMLFHSVNNGVNWTRVPVMDGSTQLSQPIVHIDAQGESIAVKTTSGTTFLTNDGGLHWIRQ